MIMLSSIEFICTWVKNRDPFFVCVFTLFIYSLHCFYNVFTIVKYLSWNKWHAISFLFLCYPIIRQQHTELYNIKIQIFINIHFLLIHKLNNNDVLICHTSALLMCLVSLQNVSRWFLVKFNDLVLNRLDKDL